MDFSALESVVVSSAILLIAVAFPIYCFIRIFKNTPYGPLRIPIIGHLHLLKPPVHRTFLDLSEKYGPVFFFRFGSHPAVIISSASAAEECFTKNDAVLANRYNFSTMSKYVSYNFSTMANSSYGDHWRNLRKIGVIEIFSSHRLNLFTDVRKDEVRRLLVNLAEKSRGEYCKVELRSMLYDLTLNNIMRMVAGRRYYGNGDTINESEAKEFRNVMASIIKNAGVGHVEDFLPVLRWVKGGKFEREIKSIAARCDKLLQGLIDEHREKKSASSTMIDRMLSLQKEQPLYYTDDIIKGFILIMLLAGTDTTAVSMEWAMTLMMNKPEVLERAKREIESLIGEKRVIEESDIADLPYLQGIISETLRLQPPAPLLVPHYSSEDCVIGGFKVPRHTMVIANAWAIQRDPMIWDDAESFKPERFEGRGDHDSHRLLPFGLGRRACPGMGLANRVMGLTLGAMIQCFDWRRISEDLIDMTEATGSVISKKYPLQLECKSLHLVTNLLCPAE